jgi:hypothetical protein
MKPRIQILVSPKEKKSKEKKDRKKIEKQGFGVS